MGKEIGKYPGYNDYDDQAGTPLWCAFTDDLTDRTKSFFIIKLNNNLHKYFQAVIYKVNF